MKKRTSGLTNTERVIRSRRRKHPVDDIVSPERALELLRQIQTHRVTLKDDKVLTGITQLTQEQVQILYSLLVKKPTSNVAFVDL